MLAEAPLESPAESVGAAVLDDHDLLGVVLGWALRAASDDALPWCSDAKGRFERRHVIRHHKRDMTHDGEQQVT